SSPYYHRLYAAWAPGGVVSTYSSDGGVSWSGPQQIPNSGGAPIEYPYPVVAPNGDVFLFHMYDWDARSPSPSTVKVVKSTNGVDVMYSASTDHGATWGQATRLSHDPTGVVRDHITPMLDVSGDGRLHAMWLDRRLDPANRLFQVWYSSSTDGGATWEADSQV